MKSDLGKTANTVHPGHWLLALCFMVQQRKALYKATMKQMRGCDKNWLKTPMLFPQAAKNLQRKH